MSKKASDDFGQICIAQSERFPRAQQSFVVSIGLRCTVAIVIVQIDWWFSRTRQVAQIRGTDGRGEEAANMEKCLTECVIGMGEIVVPTVLHKQTVFAHENQVGAKLELSNALDELVPCSGGDVTTGEVFFR